MTSKFYVMMRNHEGVWWLSASAASSWCDARIDARVFITRAEAEQYAELIKNRLAARAQPGQEWHWRSKVKVVEERG